MSIYSQIENVLKTSSPQTFLQDLNKSLKTYTFSIKTEATDILTIIGKSRRGNVEFDIEKKGNSLLLFPLAFDEQDRLRPVELINGGYSGLLLSDTDIYKLKENSKYYN